MEQQSLPKLQPLLWLLAYPLLEPEECTCFAMCASCHRPQTWPAITMTSHPSLLPAPFVLSSPPAPVVVCLGLETLEEGEVSSVASEGNPARTLPTKTHLAQPAGDLDPQLHQVS